MTTKWDEDALKALSGKLDARDSSNMLPLHHALKQKAPIAIVQALISEYREAASAKDIDSKLPLHHAAERNLDIEYYNCLIAVYPRAVRERDDKGLLPFHHLVRFCTNLDVIKLFLTHFPDSIRERDKDGWLPLHFAARDNASLDVAEILVARYAGGLCEKSQHGSLPIHCAAHYNNNICVIQYLANQHPSSLTQGGNKGMWPVHCAARNNPCLDVLKLLIKLLPTSVVAEDEDHRLPLHHAIRNISLNVVKYLIDLYPQALKKKDANGWLPVHTAARFSMNLELMILLTAHYPEGLRAPDEEEWLPLHHAARSNLSLDVVKHVIKLYPEALLLKAVSVDKYVHELAPESSDKKVLLALLFTALNRDSVQSLGVIRLHLIGDGYAGKTVCSKWIKDLISLTMLNWQNIDLFDSAMEVPMTERTRGMETTHLSHSVTLTDNRVTHYLIHDYAGQQEYLLNHATFLNQPDSVFVLVLPLFDKVKKQRCSVDTLVQRALFWLKFLFSSTHQQYPQGVPICVVLNTFESDVVIPHEDLDHVRRKVMSAARRLYSFRTLSSLLDGSDGARSADFLLVGDEVLLVDARMKFSVRLLIESLKIAASYMLAHSQSRQSKLQAYCWEILNMLNLSVVMREEDLHFLVTSSVKSFFNKQLQSYLIGQQIRDSEPTAEEVANLTLLKEMKLRGHIVTQVEEMLAEYVMEILQALGKVLVIKQQRHTHGSRGPGAEAESGADAEDADEDSIVITSPHDLSHTILGHLNGNLRSFMGKEHSPYDLILKPAQIQLLLTYLPVMPVTVPRLLVLLGVCIPVRFSREHQRVGSVFDAPQYNPVYLNPAPAPLAQGPPSSQSLGFAAYSLHAGSAFAQSTAHSYGAPLPPPPSTLPPPLPPVPVQTEPEEETCYWAIGLVQKSVTQETDFSRIRLLPSMTRVLSRVFLLSSDKFMLIPGFFVKLFVFLYHLEPTSENLCVYKDAFNLVARTRLEDPVPRRRAADCPTPKSPPVPATSPSAIETGQPQPQPQPQPCSLAHGDHEDADVPSVLPPRTPLASSTEVEDSVEPHALEPQAETTELPVVDGAAAEDSDEESRSGLPEAPEAPELDELEEADEPAELMFECARQLLVLPYQGSGGEVGFQVTVATDLPREPLVERDYCEQVLLRLRQFLQQEMWGIDLREHCLAAPTLCEDLERDEVSALPENRFYASNVYTNIFQNANTSGVTTEVMNTGVGFDIVRVEDCENAWFCGPAALRPRVREQLFGFRDPAALAPREDADDADAVVPLHCGSARPLPLLGPYSTYSCAVETMARCLILADAAALDVTDVQMLLLDRVRAIGVTCKSGAPGLNDALGLSASQLADMTLQARERYQELQGGAERLSLASRDPADLPCLPVLTACHPQGSIFTPQGDVCSEDRPHVRDFRLHFLCPVCGQRAPSGGDGDGYKLSVLSRHASGALLRALSATLATCEALVRVAQSNRSGGANLGELLALGALLQDSMDLLLLQPQGGLQITVERTHRLQNHLFQLMKDFLLREQRQLALAQQGASAAGSAQHQQARLGLLGLLRTPLVSEEDQHLMPPLRTDAQLQRGLVDLLLAAGDQHLLHSGLQRVVHSSGAVAWVCAPGESEPVTDLLDAVGGGLAALSQGVARLAAGPAVPLSSRTTSAAVHSSCAEEFLRRGPDCLALKFAF